MKKLVLCLLVALAFVVPAASFGGQYENPEVVAQVFAGVNFDLYSARFEFRNASGEKEKGEYLSGQFWMDKRGIYRFVLGEKVIVDVDANPGDVPLPGFPQVSDGEMRDFYLSIFAWSRDGKKEMLVATGNFSTRLLEPGQAIVVVMEPPAVRQVVPYTPEPGVNVSDLRLELELPQGGFVWVGYGEFARGFEVWVNPAFVWKYKIKAGEIIYVVGEIDVLAGEKKPKTSAVNVELAAQVHRVEFDANNAAWYERLRLGAVVERCLEGVAACQKKGPVPAEVFAVKLAGKALTINTSGIFGLIEVKKVVAVEAGAMPLLDSTPANYLHIPAGYDAVVVVITGVVEYPDQGFWASFYRTDY